MDIVHHINIASILPHTMHNINVPLPGLRLPPAWMVFIPLWRLHRSLFLFSPFPHTYSSTAVPRSFLYYYSVNSLILSPSHVGIILSKKMRFSLNAPFLILALAQILEIGLVNAHENDSPKRHLFKRIADGLPDPAFGRSADLVRNLRHTFKSLGGSFASRASLARRSTNTATKLKRSSPRDVAQPTFHLVQSYVRV